MQFHSMEFAWDSLDANEKDCPRSTRRLTPLRSGQALLRPKKRTVAWTVLGYFTYGYRVQDRVQRKSEVRGYVGTGIYLGYGEVDEERRQNCSSLCLGR